MTEKKNRLNNNPTKENKFDQAQPLRHPLAVVVWDKDQVKINKQLYKVVINKAEALDIELLRQKYDPYLDQYDFLVGDISSDHLRLKGFYQDRVQTAIDRKEQTIADYLMEYCNPGEPYFILQLLSPVHRYHNRKKRKATYRNYKQGFRGRGSNKSFKRYHMRQPYIKKHETIAVKKEYGKRHSFVIKKRRSSK